MREKVKDKGRLEHILQACNDLLASKDKYTFDAVKDDPIGGCNLNCVKACS